jgi:hypothetical protein
LHKLQSLRRPMPNLTTKGYALTRFSLQGSSIANIKSMVVTCIFVTADSRAEKPRLECQSDEAIWYAMCASALGIEEVEELFTTGIGDCGRKRCSVQPRSLHSVKLTRGNRHRPRPSGELPRVFCSASR